MSLRDDVIRIFSLPPVNFRWKSQGLGAAVSGFGGVVQCPTPSRAILLVAMVDDPKAVKWAVNLLTLLFVVAGWNDGDKWLHQCINAARLSQYGGLYKTIHQGIRYELIINKTMGLTTLTVDSPAPTQFPATDPQPGPGNPEPSVESE